MVQAKKDAFFEKLSEKEGGATYANVHSVMLELMTNELPDGSFETEDEIYQRAQGVKQFCKNFLAEHPLEGDEKIAVVCHSKLIAAVTAGGFSGVGASSKLTDFVWTANSEVLPIEDAGLNTI